MQNHCLNISSTPSVGSHCLPEVGKLCGSPREGRLPSPAVPRRDSRW